MSLNFVAFKNIKFFIMIINKRLYFITKHLLIPMFKLFMFFEFH